MKWWRRLLFRDRLENDLDKELRFHLEKQAADFVERGHSPDEARRLARLNFGGNAQVMEECRDARGTRWLEDLWRDLRFARRTLAKKPGFLAVSLLTLSLGIGATTVMFTLIDCVLLKALPYPRPAELVTVQSHTTSFGNQYLAYLDYLDCQAQTRSLRSVAAWLFDSGTLSEPGDPENVELREATSNLFAVLGVSTVRGRGFVPAEDHPGGAPVAVIGYSLWQRRFGGSDAAIGSSLVLNGNRYVIVGVAPASLRMDGEPDVVLSLGQDTAGYLQNRRAHPVRVVARLRNANGLAQAQTELALLGSRLEAQYPASNKGRSFVVQPLRPDVGDVQSTLWLLLGAVTLVLLIACVNVASLLLARAASRDRELAMRMALGAGRSRLVRQCLTESAVLGVCGGILGIALAALGIQPFVALWPGSLPRAEEVHLDWRVLLFAIAVSLVSGLVFGLAPALRTPAAHLEKSLRAGGRSIVGGSPRMHSGFVISEIALAVILLVSAGMLGSTMLHLSSLAPGFDIHNVLFARVRLSPSVATKPEQMRAAWQDAISQARRIPGVLAVATVDTLPMRAGFNELGYATNADIPDPQQLPVALATSVSPDYLQVMAIPLLHGRFFDDHDRLGSEPAVVIDEELARRAFHGKNAIGQRLWVPDMGAQPMRVVGVVGHVRHWGLAGDDSAAVRAQLYYPFAQVPDPLVRRWSELTSIVVRTSVPPLSLEEPLRRAIRGSTADQVLYSAGTMEQLAGESLSRQRFLLVLFGVFAALALTLASIGLYGVMAYLTGQRVPEIGVRMALGATAGEVLWMVLRQSLGMIAFGVVGGIAAALEAERILQKLVEGMQPTQASTFATMIAVLLAAALGASLIPAIRAARIDPVKALRQE